MNISSHLQKFRFSSGDIDLELEPKVATGYEAGFIVRKDLNQAWRLKAEPRIIKLGARYNESFTLRESEFETDSRTEYLFIQLPLLVQLSTVPPEKTVYGRPFATTTFHLTGGVFGGYLLDARFSGTNTGEPVGIPFESNFSNDIIIQSSRYDGGVILGAGLEHGYDSKIGFETRLLYTAIVSGNVPDLPKNMAMTFSVYYIF